MTNMRAKFEAYKTTSSWMPTNPMWNVHQLRTATDNDIKSITVADTELRASSEFKSLGVLLDQQLSFQKHTTAVATACNYHIQAIRHVRPLLTRDVAETLTCSLVNNRLDYCNSLTYGAPVSSINKLQRVLNNDARVVTQSCQCTDARPLLVSLHWLPVQQRITFKLALVTFKTVKTSSPSYLNAHLTPAVRSQSPRSSSRPLLQVPACTTTFARRAFSYAAPHLYGTHYLQTFRLVHQLLFFKTKLKTLLYREAFNCWF